MYLKQKKAHMYFIKPVPYAAIYKCIVDWVVVHLGPGRESISSRHRLFE